VLRLLSSTSKPSGRKPKRLSRALITAAVRTTRPRPRSRVTKARPASLRSPRARPTQVAQIGSRSGLTAIAPTIRIELLEMTPQAAITAATLIRAR